MKKEKYEIPMSEFEGMCVNFLIWFYIAINYNIKYFILLNEFRISPGHSGNNEHFIIYINNYYIIPQRLSIFFSYSR